MVRVNSVLEECALAVCLDGLHGWPREHGGAGCLGLPARSGRSRGVQDWRCFWTVRSAD